MSGGGGGVEAKEIVERGGGWVGMGYKNALNSQPTPKTLF